MMPQSAADSSSSKAPDAPRKRRYSAKRAVSRGSKRGRKSSSARRPTSKGRHPTPSAWSPYVVHDPTVTGRAQIVGRLAAQVESLLMRQGLSVAKVSRELRIPYAVLVRHARGLGWNMGVRKGPCFFKKMSADLHTQIRERYRNRHAVPPNWTAFAKEAGVSRQCIHEIVQRLQVADAERSRTRREARAKKSQEGAALERKLARLQGRGKSARTSHRAAS